MSSGFAESDRERGRPVSPHLQIYRFTTLMLSSVAHRLTGALLSVGVLVWTGYLAALSISPHAFNAYLSFLTSAFGKFVIFVLLWALAQHVVGGIRHFIWDFGKMMAVADADVLARWGAIAAFLIALGLFVGAHLLA